MGESTMTSSQEESRSFINLGIVLNAKGEILMIKRKKEEKGRGGSVLTWVFPGGKQRYSESRKECVEREVLDETGYSILADKEISMRFHPQFSVIVVYHLCCLGKPRPVSQPKEDWEVEEIRWIPKEKIKELITSDLDQKVAEELGV
jgi:ADP-ribose pyrophosphatase YjhB (NUDIX family)